MAKIEGTQTIPAAWQDEYIAQMALENTKDVVKKRYPFRLPFFQKGGPKVTGKQLAQRARFSSAVDIFNSLAESSRSRWYDAAPDYGAGLWYYNFWIQNAINGVLGVIQPGADVIKQNIFTNMSVGTGGGVLTFSPAVDPEKAVVLLNGNAPSTYETQQIGFGYGWAFPVAPYAHGLDSTLLTIDWSVGPTAGGNVTIQIIEYI